MAVGGVAPLGAQAQEAQRLQARLGGLEEQVQHIGLKGCFTIRCCDSNVILTRCYQKQWDRYQKQYD